VYDHLSVWRTTPCLAWGFTATAGALVAIALGRSMVTLSSVLVSIGAALFIALALEPVVRRLEKRGLSRGLSITVVFAAFVVVFGGVIAIVAPVAVTQITEFAKAVPGYVANIQNTAWFQALGAATGQDDTYQLLLDQARSWLSNPANLLAVGGGALAVGTGIVQFVSTGLIVLVLTLYFLASMRSMKAALQRLAPAYARPRLASITALLLMTVVTLFSSPVSALIFAVVYLVDMQVEAYVLTPRVMNKAVDIPGTLVLIGAMVGGTLLGLLGALVAVPVTASVLLIIKDTYIPRQDAKLTADT
jgi:predicted PurR-regulated permease PerM